MHKIYVTGIILFNCYCNVKSVTVCDRILRKKGYIGVIETAKREFNPAAMTTPNSVCQVGRKFSNELFTDPGAWLCLGNIVLMIKDNMALYNASVAKCNVINRFTAIACGDFAIFQLCIHVKMHVTLQGLASGEGWDQNSCIKCREYSDFKPCVTEWKLDTQCPPLTRNVLNMTFARKSCIACKHQAPSTSGSSTSGPSTSGPSTSGPSTTAPSTSSPSTTAIVAGFAGIAVVVVLLGIGYSRFRRAKRARELSFSETPSQILGSNLSFTSSEKGDGFKVGSDSSSISSDRHSSRSHKRSRRRRRKRRK